jgi:hypothetical protein
LFICAEASSIFFFENLAAPIAHSLLHGAVGTRTTNYIFLEREFRTIFCFSLLVCFNNGKYFDRFSVTRHTIVENSSRWAMGNVYQFIWEYLRNFPNSSSFFNICFLVTRIYHICFQFMAVDATGFDKHIFELANSEPLMFRLNFVALATIEDQFGENTADESLKIATKQLSGVVLRWIFLLLSLYH